MFFNRDKFVPSSSSSSRQEDCRRPLMDAGMWPLNISCLLVSSQDLLVARGGSCHCLSFRGLFLKRAEKPTSAGFSNEPSVPSHWTSLLFFPLLNNPETVTKMKISICEQFFFFLHFGAPESDTKKWACVSKVNLKRHQSFCVLPLRAYLRGHFQWTHAICNGFRKTVR